MTAVGHQGTVLGFQVSFSASFIARSSHSRGSRIIAAILHSRAVIHCSSGKITTAECASCNHSGLALQPGVTESTSEPLIARRCGCFSDRYLTASVMHAGRCVSQPGHNSKGKLFTCTSSEAACNSCRLWSCTTLSSQTSTISRCVVI